MCVPTTSHGRLGAMSQPKHYPWSLDLDLGERERRIPSDAQAHEVLRGLASAFATDRTGFLASLQLDAAVKSRRA